MHELSIAVALVEAACEKAAELGGVRVEALHLRLGALSGVVKDALLFSFEIASKDTAVEGARLEIVEVPLVVRCAPCAAEHELKDPFLLCPVCGEPTPEVVRGKELEFSSLEVTDHAESAHR